MKIVIKLLLLFLLIAPAQAQATPQITDFSTSLSSIGRDALANRSARIPVTWSTLNRPVAANLVFEQILPDRSVINVELPRLIPYVASSGDGIAAPTLPITSSGTPAPAVVLRVSLVSVLTGHVFDAMLLDVPIVDGTGGAAARDAMPTITDFSARVDAPIDAQQLAAGTVRIPVTWNASNRPLTANLVFEQVLAGGSVVNVELPRPWLWVNSNDAGVVAPVAPGAVNEAIVLRVRLVDLLYGRTYDQRSIRIPLSTTQTGSGAPAFTRFRSEVNLVSAADVRAGLVRIPVVWTLTNRPANSNLVFEQVMPDGTLRNAELPRDVLLVPSSGTGTVTAAMPEGSTSLVYQVRLIDLPSGATLITSPRMIVTIAGGTSPTGEIEVTGAACYQPPFPPSSGLQNGASGRVPYVYNGMKLGLYAEQDTQTLLLELEPGETFIVLSEPYCVRPDGDTNYSRRQWQINARGIIGWATEYSGALDYGYVFMMSGGDVPTQPDAEITRFEVTPSRISSMNETITVTWETRGAEQVTLHLYGASSPYPDNLGSSGTLRLRPADYGVTANPFMLELSARDSRQNYDTVQQSVAVDSEVSIQQFSVSPDTARGNTSVTFTWQIAGDFERGYIQWVPNSPRPSLTPITEITASSGTHAFRLPDWTVGSYEIMLSVTDRSGLTQTTSTTLTITCAYEWGMAVAEEGCPAQNVQTLQGAYQAFERGFLIWVPDDSVPMWMLLNNGTAYRFSDQWDGSALSEETPPAGLLAPERGFGWLWRHESTVRDGLGWAVAPEQAYTLTTQRTLSPGRYDPVRWYLTLPDGAMVRLSASPNISTLQWERLP